jgi:hypothetical protein
MLAVTAHVWLLIQEWVDTAQSPPQRAKPPLTTLQAHCKPARINAGNISCPQLQKETCHLDYRWKQIAASRNASKQCSRNM